MAIEKAHDPWRDSIAGATVDWGETISGCGAEECLGRSRRGHVMEKQRCEMQRTMTILHELMGSFKDGL
jgi:hypothetical protein